MASSSQQLDTMEVEQQQQQQDHVSSIHEEQQQNQQNQQNQHNQQNQQIAATTPPEHEAEVAAPAPAPAPRLAVRNDAQLLGLEVEQRNLIEQKTREIHRDVQAVLQGTHEEFVWRYKRLQQMVDEKVATATKYKELQVQAITRACDGEIEQTRKDFEQEVNSLRERMINALMDKQKKLEEEKLDVPANFSDDYLMSSNTGSRKLRRRQKDVELAKPSINHVSYETYTKKKKIPVTINFALAYEEINDDVSQILKGGKKW